MGLGNEAAQSRQIALPLLILEQVTVGVCEECGNRYYDAAILHTVHELAAGQMDGEDGAAADGDDSRSASRVRLRLIRRGVVTGG